jgi:anaphase-promoting complex subunit 1
LFLAGGQYAFKTSSTFAIAAMVTSLYPLFPKTESAEPDVHLQALRHFWSMAVEPRCLVVRNVDTSKPVKTEVTVDFKNKESKRLMTPCLLPPIDTIQKVTFESEDYFKLVVDDLSSLNNRLDLFVYKRSRVEVLKQSVRIILKDINEKFQEDLVVCNGKDLTHLDVFNEMKKVDVLRLIGDEPTNGFQPNMVDRQTELNQIVGDPVNVAELWNLKLIFAFYDRLLAEDDVCYLTLEYIDTLKTNLLELRCQLL